MLLTDDTVSRRHAMVRRDQNRFLVFDLGSRTGTRAGGEPITGYDLSPGETFALGRSELVVMQNPPQ